jgi:hypothetical protein
MVHGLANTGLRLNTNLLGKLLPRRKEIPVTKLSGSLDDSLTSERVSRRLIRPNSFDERRRLTVRPLLDEYTALV